MKNKLKVFGIAGIISILLAIGMLTVGRTAISELVGLSVAQSANVWNSVSDAAKGDGQSSGILAQSPYLWNGLSFDRTKGTGGSMNVQLVGAITPADAYANPTTATQIWNLNGLFNGTTWDRQRTASADALAITGMTAVGNMAWNGTSFDRMRTATADALASTGMTAVGNMTFNGSTWDRWKGQAFPVQGTNLFNTQTTGAATTAVTVTLTALANARAHVYSVEGRCNTAAATSDMLVSDGGTTIFTSQVAQVTTVNNYSKTWPTGLTGATNSQVVITWAACTAGTGTLIVQADKF